MLPFNVSIIGPSIIVYRSFLYIERRCTGMCVYIYIYAFGPAKVIIGLFWVERVMDPELWYSRSKAYKKI